MATNKTTKNAQAKKPVVESTKTEAVKTAPAVKAEPVKAEPVKTEAVKAAPAKAPAAPAAKAAPAKKAAPDKKPAAKKEAKKAEPKTPDIVELANMLRKKIGKKNASSINEKIAVEIKVYGEYENYMYILIDNGTVSVEPYGYMDNDAHIDLPIADVLSIIDGKYDYKAKILSGDFYATGSLTKLLKVKETLFK